jgi:hypothetical protein
MNLPLWVIVALLIILAFVVLYFLFLLVDRYQ